jgi:hypothetical protein
VRLSEPGIGPYPFTELEVVETPTAAEGIEYLGLTVINSSYCGGESGQLDWAAVMVRV